MIDLAIVDAVCRERRESALPRPMLQEVTAEASEAAQQRPALRAEVYQLRAAIRTPEPAAAQEASDAPERLAQIEDRLARIEARLGEQDEMFATILSKMIEWIDEDETIGRHAHGRPEPETHLKG